MPTGQIVFFGDNNLQFIATAFHSRKGSHAGPA